MKKTYKKRIAIILARKNSKRIKFKNKKQFFGLPIIARVINTVKKTNLFDTIMVSTDCNDIAKIAKKYGAEIPFYRSSKNSSDTATVKEVLLEVLNKYKRKNLSFDYGCYFYGTSVFAKKADLIKGYKKIYNKKFDVVIPVTKLDKRVWRSYSLLKDDKIQFNFPLYKDTQSQKLKDVYLDAGEWGWFVIKKFLKKKDLITNNMGSIIKNPKMVQDIDDLNDWANAKAKFIKFNLNK